MSSRTDVYIVGLGIHPFGRHEGVTGLDMGVIAVKSAFALGTGSAWRANMMNSSHAAHFAVLF